jgi:hypothetical protein
VLVNGEWEDVVMVEGVAVCVACRVMLVVGEYAGSDLAVFFDGTVRVLGESMVEGEWESLVAAHEEWHAASLASPVVSSRLSGREMVERRKVGDWESPLPNRRGGTRRRLGRTSLVVIEHSADEAEVTLVEDEFGRDVEVRRGEGDFTDHSSESTVEEFEEWMTHPTAGMRQNDPDAYGVSVARALAGLYRPRGLFRFVNAPAQADVAEQRARLTAQEPYRHPLVHDTAERAEARRRWYAAR